MKALFVHDHKFIKVNDEIYSPGGLSNEILSRYTQWFGHVTVVGRIVSEDCVKKTYSKIVNPDISVVDRTNLEDFVRNADYIITRLPSINGYKATKYARKYKKPYMVEVVGCTLDAYWNYSWFGKMVALPAYVIMRHSVKWASYAIYVTSQFLQKRYPCQGKTIGVSDVDIEGTCDNVLEKRLEKIGKNEDALVIGTAGAIDVEYKGQEYVIKLIKRLIEITGKDIRYELAGAGDPQRLMSIAEDCGVSDKVIFKGLIKHENMFEWLDSIDIYIQSSLLEGLSRALVEAMSRGLPCVAANKGGNPELIEKPFLFSTKVKSEIPMLLLNCIKELLPLDRRKEAAVRNYKVANRDFNCDVLNNKRNEFYLSFKEYCVTKERFRR